MRTGYTRKIFHVLTFITAATLHGWYNATMQLAPAFLASILLSG
ncbi:MAG TPA: hypothetical protein VI756_22660 [Blastocatellia bacterium]